MYVECRYHVFRIKIINYIILFKIIFVFIKENNLIMDCRIVKS